MLCNCVRDRRERGCRGRGERGGGGGRREGGGVRGV